VASMTVKRSFQVLELAPGATLNEVRQAYKDMANIWHPDRFSGNPRLQYKAEQKLKEINAAYETLKAFFQGHALSGRAATHNDAMMNNRRVPVTSRTEMAAEAGTVFVLGLLSHISSAWRRFVEKD